MPHLPGPSSHGDHHGGALDDDRVDPNTHHGVGGSLMFKEHTAEVCQIIII